ncbi:MAG: SlyX family protein [Alcanivoracaceae bacterium]|jgi:SlyX protein|nr:SlyX family protein [Alcanivoracaceae bacterium]
MSDERFLDIETTLAFQDDLVTALNKLVAAQQERIAALEKRCGQLEEGLQEMVEVMMAANIIDEKPPHY